MDDTVGENLRITQSATPAEPMSWSAAIAGALAATAIGFILIALGTGPTAVAYTLYFRGLRSAAASTAALLTLLEPLTGAILAALLLGERLSATGIAGAALIATAVILTIRANRGSPLDGRALAPQGAGRVGGRDGADAQPRAPR